MSSILIVDDEEGMRKSLAILFRKEGYQVYQAGSGEDAVSLLSDKEIDLIVTDMRMDGMSGADLLDEVRRTGVKMPVIIMTAYGTIDSAVEAMKKGAFDYITKPFEYEEIVHRVRKAIQSAETDEEVGTMRAAAAEVVDNDFPMIIGRSLAMADIKAQLKKIANTDLPVLITGETGTGKNLLAKAIHLNSPRFARPFKAVNCTSVPEHLFESELFGHAKGAFTGAVMERRGLFEAAKGGTILLDEIGSLPKSVQVKLLGVLQDNVIRKVGSDEEVPIDSRVLAATNVDLLAAIKRGEFREDLYYRLHVLNIHLPPLRNHREDIFDLSEYFLSVCRSRQNKADIAGFGPEVMERLHNYDFPGNVRELYNIVCRAVALAETSVISCEDLPITAHAGSSPPAEISETRAMKEWEKKIIIESIRRHPNNLAEVCRDLGIGRTTLWRKMKKYNISFEDRN
ncbi:MAG: sigma-54 dependent transcriptional regulator [Nitrospiraceae bacterium]|nr:sigma-54 dependent transcriptional regulator [Nitrospiraceae bacterium]